MTICRASHTILLAYKHSISIGSYITLEWAAIVRILILGEVQRAENNYDYVTKINKIHHLQSISDNIVAWYIYMLQNHYTDVQRHVTGIVYKSKTDRQYNWYNWLYVPYFRISLLVVENCGYYLWFSFVCAVFDLTRKMEPLFRC